MEYFHPYDVIKDLDLKVIEGTKVTFINMPIREQAKPNNAPLGPALLAARLLEYGADVNIIDLNAYRIKDDDAERRGLENGRCLTTKEVFDLIDRSFTKWGAQDLIGFSGLVTTLWWQDYVSTICRGLMPNALIISGGGLATEFRETMVSWLPQIDGIAHSEGDDVIVKMAYDAKMIRIKGVHKAYEDGDLAPYCKGIRGLGHMRKFPLMHYDGGRPPDLDKLPVPAWHLLESDIDGVDVLEIYIKNPVWGGDAMNSSAAPFTMSRSLNTVSSRGCPFACKFCFRGAQGERDYGVRSAYNLTKEISTMSGRYGLDFIGIVDDNFMVQPKRIEELVSALGPYCKARNVTWGTHGRLDEAADLKPDATGTPHFNKRLRVNDMRDAGCVYIGFGAESASPETLQAMGKGGFILKNGTTDINGYQVPVTMVEGIKNTFRAGIHANCTFIQGYPGETLHGLKATVAFIKWQEQYYTEGLTPGTTEYDNAVQSVNKNMFVATAYPGTEMFTDPIVRKSLEESFGIQFSPMGDPVPNDALYDYVLELNDATKTIQKNGKILNYAAYSDDIFMEARGYIESGEIEKILNIKEN